jgi:hypothetical protein
MENLDKKLIMLKLRDAILLQEIPNSFNISNVEEYKKDAITFFEITNQEILGASIMTHLVDTNFETPNIKSLTDILDNFGFKAHFLYNPIYDQGLEGEINNLIISVIDKENQKGALEESIQVAKTNAKTQKLINEDINLNLLFPNFYNFFFIEVPDNFEEDTVNELLSMFQNLAVNFEKPQTYILDYAHIRYSTTEASPPTITSATNTDFQSFMGFEELRTRTIAGQNGENITVIDCETGFCDANNSDFTSSISLLTPNYPNGYKKHSTQVRSILTSALSSVTALCSGINFIGSPVKISDETVNLIENAIMLGLIKLSSPSEQLNGFILIEQEDKKGKPVESLPSVYLVIQLAYSLNIAVIEPAGNNKKNINNIDNSSNWLNPLNITRINIIMTTYRSSATLIRLIDAITTVYINPRTKKRTLRLNPNRNPYGKSKAIIVGGYLNRNGKASNNFGAAVTCFAQGFGVPSFYYNTDKSKNCLEPPIFESFNNTSAASAIMAGFVAILQSVQLNRTPPSRALKPDEIREAIIFGKISGTIGIPNIMQSVNHILSKTYAP